MAKKKKRQMPEGLEVWALEQHPGHFLRTPITTPSGGKHPSFRTRPRSRAPVGRDELGTNC